MSTRNSWVPRSGSSASGVSVLMPARVPNRSGWPSVTTAKCIAWMNSAVARAPLPHICANVPSALR